MAKKKAIAPIGKKIYLINKLVNVCKLQEQNSSMKTERVIHATFTEEQFATLLAIQADYKDIKYTGARMGTVSYQESIFPELNAEI